MRILFDATPLQTGHRARGIGTYTRELLRALLLLESDDDFLPIIHGTPDDLCRDLGFDHLPPRVTPLSLRRPPFGRLSGFASHQIALPALLRRQRADLFHAPGFVAALSVPGIPWRVPQPLVVTLHDFLPLRVPELFSGKTVNRLWYRRQMAAARRATRLICVSQATRADAIDLLRASPDRCVVVHEGVEKDTFHPAAAGDQTADPPTILFVGGSFANKNRRRALAAFARLTNATTLPHRMVLVGPDDLSDAELLSQHPDLDIRRVRRVAHVSQQELAHLYRSADLFLFPSLAEGFGLPVLEAMASGTPVVTSRASSLPEVAGDAALLVDPTDTDAIAAAVGHALADPTLHRRLRTAGLARAAQFTWQTAAQQTLAVYRSMAG
ncbi:MAG: glycosyltransferase family 1 protein [Caldilineales bacterium]